jgi:hypothetical protein
MEKKHYVYLLINKKPIDKKKYYIGVRSCICEPSEDKYFSSSKIIKKIIKEQGLIFTKKILKIFRTREDAVNFEILLHKKFNVGENFKYYNIVNQTTNKFDTTGFIFINGKKIPITDYKMSLEKYHSFGKVTLQNVLGEKFYVDVQDENYKKGILFGLTKNMVPVLDKINNEYVNIPKNEYNKEIHVSSNKGKVPVIDENGNTFLTDINNEDYKNGILKSVHKNKILCKNKEGKTLLISKDEYIENNYVGINKGKVSGYNNPNAKTITIFDSNNNIVNICKGDFKKFCTNNNYPHNSLARSYRNNGSKIFSNIRTHSYMIRNNFQNFKGWYALISE